MLRSDQGERLGLALWTPHSLEPCVNIGKILVIGLAMLVAKGEKAKQHDIG
ncbi:MAG: hypothetical protein CM15mP120_02310 [Pseudomonadota bacterium]|nr:MAG: hypothetical protein CM15mP120_02310 [Pseudomonadota bacterium]